MNVKSATLFALGALILCGCVSDVEKVRREMNILIAQNKFDEARDFKVKRNPGGIPQTDEEKAKNEMLPLVDRAEAKYIAARIKQLRELVMADLKKGDDAAARKHIYTFGITGQSRVDAAVFLIKTGMLNSRVNPAAYARIGSATEKEAREALANGDFQKAIEAYRRIRLVMAYPDAVDAGLDEASAEAVRQRCEKEGVEALIADAKMWAYGTIAPRDGYEKTDIVPVWTKVEEQLDVVREALVQDDIPQDEAQKLVDGLLAGIKAYFNDHATDEEMTTQELNERLDALRNDLNLAIQNAIQEAIKKEVAKLAAEEAARNAAAEAAKKAAMEMAAKAATEELARLRQLSRDFAAMVASDIDMNARVGALIAAIGDRAEPDVNRILGDGARVLRLYLHGEEAAISPADATSLLAAAAYMGFGDIANLAFALKADVNGASAKDSFGRTPYLLALQHGFKGGVKNLLAQADRKKADAYGYDALHYAVRYGTTGDLMEAINLGIDAKAAAKDGVTPLMVAARLGNAPFAQALIPMSDVKAADQNGYTALHYAIDAGSLPITKSLILSGADPMAKSKEGDTAIERAVMRLDEAILAYLLDDVKVNGKNLAPTTRAVDWCVVHSKVIPLTTLVAHGAKVTDRHLAAAVLTDMNDDVLDMVKYLVELGCDVNAEEVHKAVRMSSDNVRKVEEDARAAEASASAKAAAVAKAAGHSKSLVYLKDNGFRDEDGTPRFAK